jgi:hypothetical protein
MARIAILPVTGSYWYGRMVGDDDESGQWAISAAIVQKCASTGYRSPTWTRTHAWKVSRRVNSPKLKNDASLIEPLPA